MFRKLVLLVALAAMGCEGQNEPRYKPAPMSREVCDFTPFVARVAGVDWVFITDHWDRMEAARDFGFQKAILDPGFFCQPNTEYTEESYGIAWQAEVPTTYTNLPPDYWADVFAWFLADGDGSAHVYALLNEKVLSTYPRLDACPGASFTRHIGKVTVKPIQ